MKYLNKFALFSAIVAAMLFSGCATISDGPSQIVTIKASDDANLNAIIETTSGWFPSSTAQTTNVRLPATIAVSRSSGARVKILAKDNLGYQDTEFVIQGKAGLNLWYFGNILFGGLYGTTTTDPWSGAMWKYSNPNFVVPVVKTTGKESK